MLIYYRRKLIFKFLFIENSRRKKSLRGRKKTTWWAKEIGARECCKKITIRAGEKVIRKLEIGWD